MLTASGLLGADFEAAVFSGPAYRRLWESRVLALLRSTLEGSAVTLHLATSVGFTQRQLLELPAPWIVVVRKPDHITRILVSGESSSLTGCVRFANFVSQRRGYYVIDASRAYDDGLAVIDVVVVTSGRDIPRGLGDALSRSPWLVLIDDLTATHPDLAWRRAVSHSTHLAMKPLDGSERFLVNQAGNDAILDLPDLVTALWSETNLS